VRGEGATHSATLASLQTFGVFWKKLELTFSKIQIYDFRPLLPRQSSIDFQNGKFFFPLKKTGGAKF